MVDTRAASRERRQHIVSYLVEYNLADAREIAIAASQEFGAPRCSTWTLFSPTSRSYD